MSTPPRRVAVMMDLQWGYKRHAAVFAGTQRYAEAQRWHTTIDEFVLQTLPTHRRKSLPYDGIIARASRELAERASQLGIPVVNVWANSPARALLPGIFADATAAGRLFAEHLLARGFRTFATLTFSKDVEHELEVREFARVVQQAGFGCLSDRVPQNPWRDLVQWRKTEQVIRRWMDRWHPPVGVYVSNEGVGRMVVQECHRRRWRVPADVAVIAGKNEETLCEHPRPSLTSLEVGYDRIGFEAARLLDRLMDGQAPPPREMLIAPQGLVVRESTDFFAVEDPTVASALAYISANCHRSIGPDDVARAAGVETRTLQNYMHKALGRPIAAEIRRVRIERAKRELVQSTRSLAAIARDVGFVSAQRLYEVFRREVGVPPGEYRKQRQLKDATSANPKTAPLQKVAQDAGNC